MASFDRGATWQELGQTAGPAVIGRVETVLPENGSALLDRSSSVTVDLLNAGMLLEARSDAALAAGANLALVGDEIIQFGSAEAIGAGRFRLSSLLRGRFGTEWASGAHQAGEDFVLLDRAMLLPLDLPAASVGAEVQVVAAGLEDGPEGVKVTRPVSGEALRPPSPVHLRASRNADGGVAISWARRSRSGWAWVNGADAPLGEQSEAYEVTISGAGFERRARAAQPSYVYGPSEQASDGASGSVTIAVAQIGTHARSRNATRILVL
jgi:hypothetical protein